LVTGYTVSTETTFPDGDDDANDTFPVPGFDQTHNGLSDAFAAKLNASGTSLVYAGYIGGSSSETGFAIAVDGPGNAYVTGNTGSDQTSFPDGDPDGNDAFPVPGPDQTHNGIADVFVVKVGAAGTSLVYAGYIGGSGSESGHEIVVDGSGNAYVGGVTGSDQTTFPDGDDDANDTFPVPSFDQTHNGSNDAFVAKIEAFPLPAPPPTPAPGPSTPGATCKGAAATLVGTTAGETLIGTSGRDVVAALGGNDTVKTQGGNDLVCAGDGRDMANGGAGRDKVFGENGRDTLKGNVGKDTLNGGQGNDSCVGGSGKDKAPGCEQEKSAT
jgi:Ca2+-binding RTX toxin-like protein